MAQSQITAGQVRAVQRASAQAEGPVAQRVSVRQPERVAQQVSAPQRVAPQAGQALTRPRERQEQAARGQPPVVRRAVEPVARLAARPAVP